MDKWRDKQFWKIFIAGIIRKILFAVGTYLTSKGWLSSDSFDGITAYSLAEFLAGIVLMLVPILWQYARNKYTVIIEKAASDSPIEQPLSVVKTDVLSEHKFISPV